MLRRLIKEPFLHFMAIGAGFFVLYLALNPDAVSSEKQIVVDAGRINQITSSFEKMWQREPTQDELRSLVDKYVIEEILYRQAIAMGIDKNDSFIRRRLRQKMTFYAEDMATNVPPERGDLAGYLEQHAARYEIPAQIDFEQVFISADRAHDDLESRIGDVASALKAGEDVSGDSDVLARRFENASPRTVDLKFGAGFFATLAELPGDGWQGPVSSGLGVHFVRVSSFTPRRVPDLDDVIDLVQSDWQQDRSAALRDTVYEKLRNEYDIVIRWPEPRAPQS